MSKIKFLLDVVSDLRSLADSVQAVADAIASNEPEEVSKPEQPQSEKQPEEKRVTLEEVRTVLAEKSHDGFTAEVRALLQKYGASKLSEIDPSKYIAFLEDAEGLK
ncbi:rRNA biogenesis protein rrp5 [Heyndrickxia coagulans]|uniref:rRNA biogenesis protein rrp5 n=1 Tax=Heyndrickxia coagulans TaxID=1398 RepID=UPI0018A7D169|nr:rRNA biogenesis protein rrp5 [Heyndrickxia coagulans]QPG52978.1 rRNA biogenesis protein rrp5 [Heyndrickxia coagulans]WNE61001.1 rRNA biogenesis protein rrp5 [Heyndrickxia coagulans]